MAKLKAADHDRFVGRARYRLITFRIVVSAWVGAKL